MPREDPTRRLRDIGDARLDIEEALTAPAQSQTAQSLFPVRRWPTRVAWALAAISTAALIGSLGIPYVRGTRASAEPAVRFTLAPPPDTVLLRPSGGNFFALSPDGRRLVFAAVRVPVRVCCGSVHSMRSRHNRYQALKRPVPNLVTRQSNGGVCRGRQAESYRRGRWADAHAVRDPGEVGFFYGGSWSPDGGTIVFALMPGGLFSVPANGGSPTALANPGATPGEGRLFPAILPDGQHFVYLSSPSNVAWLGSLDSREPAVRLLNADSQVEDVASGYLVFVRRGTLMAQRLRRAKRQARGRRCTDRGRSNGGPQVTGQHSRRP